ncbi:MAG: homoprotocatechuate degradation operon regulator, HpaR [Rickettsiales bacterium]|jgi:DNA-binding MarR family transcriptional regulator|nr:homoprotocatechuate degradation operon regulator, HpaR [Rickettsiales bacterium]
MQLIFPIMSTKYPSNLEDHLGYWLRCLSNLVSHSFAQRLGAHDVSVAQWMVLRHLYEQKPLTLSEAAAMVGVDKSSLSRMVERLVHKGFISRKNGSDRRMLHLALTAEGKRLVPLLAKEADKNDEAFFHSLSRNEKRDLLATIQRLMVSNDWDITTHGKHRMK